MKLIKRYVLSIFENISAHMLFVPFFFETKGTRQACESIAVKVWEIIIWGIKKIQPRAI